ncbi:MAG: PAS domain S-box protein [Ignavibacteriales bacterium]|nr:PAS domain S-box protein [Ignavibacteriales bacterium]
MQHYIQSNINIYTSSSIEANNVYSFIEHSIYGLLVGSAKGLYRLEQDTLLKYNFNNEDIKDPIYFIIQDSSKNIWLGTNNGVLKWDGKNLKRYNKNDGLAGNETNRAAGFVDSKGNVWIGTDEGVSMYTGNEPDYASFPPKVMLLDFKDHSNFRYSTNNNVNVDPDKNNLTFHYRGLSFLDEKRNSYQIKLSEVDGDYYNEFTTKATSARFNNLAPGDYVFSVRVKNSKGIWSNWANSSVITVKKFFYQELFFQLGVLGLFLFITYSLYNYIQQKKYTKQLEHAVDIRTKDLRETQDQLITSANRYKGIIESQSDLVVRLTEEGILTFVNDAYCSVFGKKQDELIGKSFVPLVHPDDLAPTFEEIKKLKDYPYRGTIEQRGRTIDGYRWYSWEGYAIRDPFGQILEIQAVGRDITLQKEIESELEKRVTERTIELQSLISQSPLGILTFDSEGKLITFNKIANQMFEFLDEYIGSEQNYNLFKDEFLVKNNYADKLFNLDAPHGFLLTPPILIDSVSNKIYSKLFNHFLVYRIYILKFDENNKTYVMLVDDVTEQQNTEEVSKRLLEEKIRISTIFKTIESERERFAKELHDGLGQLLTTAKLKLDIIKLKTDKSILEINDTVNLLINAGDEIRRIISDLKPSDVENFGLSSSIELLIERTRQAAGINIILAILTTTEFKNKNTEIIIYRIVQEALNNIVKHSNCKNAVIELSSSDSELQLNIIDDGVGLEITKLNEK